MFGSIPLSKPYPAGLIDRSTNSLALHKHRSPCSPSFAPRYLTWPPMHPLPPPLPPPKQSVKPTPSLLLLLNSSRKQNIDANSLVFHSSTFYITAVLHRVYLSLVCSLFCTIVKSAIIIWLQDLSNMYIHNM
jgi:hypothetical protein